jgi:large conductance mechanosensitive channel
MKEFKKFISKGNVMEMAVGLILATYFGAIIKSLVNDIIMPPIGNLLGGVDFNELKYVIEPAVAESIDGAGDGMAQVAISYGLFINTIITFLIVAYVIFIVVKSYNKMKDKMEKKKEIKTDTPAAPTKEEELLTEIRDLLKK